MDTEIASFGEDAYSVAWHGVRFELLSERALWIPELSTLCVADIHLGKEAAFRAAGIPVPDGTCRDLKRLSNLIHRSGCDRLVILGDMVHSAQGLTPTVIEQTLSWRNRHPTVEMMLVLGNHDRKAGAIPTDWGIQSIERGHCGPIELTHEPLESPSAPTLSGHLHPKFRLKTGSDSATLPCFVQRDSLWILPAFGSFIDGHAVRFQDATYYVISGDRVVKCPGGWTRKSGA